MLKGCTSKQVLPLPPCWWHGYVKGGVAFALILPSQGSGPFAGLLGPDMAVPDTAGEEELLDCEDGLIRRAWARGREPQGLERKARGVARFVATRVCVVGIKITYGVSGWSFFQSIMEYLEGGQLSSLLEGKTNAPPSFRGEEAP